MPSAEPLLDVRQNMHSERIVAMTDHTTRQTVLKTERLIVGNWIPADRSALHAICSDPLVMQYIGDGQIWSREVCDEFIDRADWSLLTHGFCQWPVITKCDETLIGFCGFVSHTPHEHEAGLLPGGIGRAGNRGASLGAIDKGGAEIGWRLAREYWGQGLATEVAEAIVRLGFETLGLPRIVATVQKSNKASIRLIEKLGFRQISRFERLGRSMLLYAADGER